jgi:glycosyltransferase involved in cell wall biosynthesis
MRLLNGSDLRGDLRCVQLAAEADPRITVIDQHLDETEHQALIALSNCFVSLHRSEGLGLQLAEAMWLGTVVIATRYGGNLDFMNDENSLLVDATPVAVGDGRGAYPDDAMWADPDLGLAAGWMLRVAADEPFRIGLSTRAYDSMAAGYADDGPRSIHRAMVGVAVPGLPHASSPAKTRKVEDADR